MVYGLIAGLPCALCARGTEPHTLRIWSTSFRLVVTWLTERTYASTDCTGGVGETIKRKGGVSQACLGNPHLLHWTFTIWSIDSCQNRITISRAHVSTHRGNVIFWKLSADQLIVLLDRDQCSISYFLPSLGAQLIMHTSTHIGHQVVINW